MGLKASVPDLSRIAFCLVCVCILIGIAFAFGLYSGAKRNWAFAFAQRLKESLSLVVEEAPTLSGLRPTHFLQPARYDGSGVTVNNRPIDNRDLILLSGFFEDSNELRLLRRDGDVVARWPVRFSDIFPDPSPIPVPPSAIGAVLGLASGIEVAIAGWLVADPGFPGAAPGKRRRRRPR
jgi:hypothetical protein